MSGIKYPTFTELAGTNGGSGGTIVNMYTSVRNLLMYCPDDVIVEVLGLIDRGYDVLTFNGKIKAVDVI